MSFGSSEKSKKESTYKRISRIHKDCEESCKNKNVCQALQVPQEPGTGLPGFAYIYDTTINLGISKIVHTTNMLKIDKETNTEN
ncbi:hypothetical protein [Lysinibacillus xylanilyticus]|uniref:hypothetical protein n=1 Tax=Lysinibacillus xylanilyticus TaxID=582475 RepID=UPI00380BB6BA